MPAEAPIPVRAVNDKPAHCDLASLLRARPGQAGVKPAAQRRLGAAAIKLLASGADARGAFLP